MPTFTTVNDDRVIAPIRHLIDQCEDRDLADLPASPTDPLSMDELEQALFQKGLAYDAAYRVREAIETLRRPLDWYRSSGLAPDRPAEHEVVAHIILPLLLALGWSEQLLAIEWLKLDIVVFWRTLHDEHHSKLM